MINMRDFLKGIIFHTIFHSIEIASKMAYAIEAGLDSSYYMMAYKAGEALNTFLFNDNPAPAPTSLLY